MTSFQETKFRQDMPPEGGYAKIYTQRTFPRINSSTDAACVCMYAERCPKMYNFTEGKKVFAVSMAITLAGYYKHTGNKKAHYRWICELADVRMVTMTFLKAERDRMWLNHLRRLREEERELMKNVPGWRVGTFYGEPIFYTLDPNEWRDPDWPELYAHSSYGRQRFNAMWRNDSDMRGGPKWYDKYLPYYVSKY